MRPCVRVGLYAALLVLSALPHVGAGEFDGAWPEGDAIEIIAQFEAGDAKAFGLKLHVFLDKSVMEVFVNDGRACVTRVVYPGRNDLGLEMFAQSGHATLLSLDVWQMTSIW